MWGKLTPERQNQVLAAMRSQQVDDDPMGLPATPQTDPKLSELEKIVRAQNDVLAQIAQERVAGQIDRAVESEMATLPLFKEVAPALRAMTKDAIMREVVNQGSQADIKAIVLDLARKANEVHKQTRQVPGLVPSQPLAAGQAAPRMTRADLLGGKGPSLVRQALEQAGITGF